jgi:hypothetical protein
VLDHATSTDARRSKFPVRETVQYLCDLAGVCPMANWLDQTELGSVVVLDENPTAIVSLPWPEYALPTRQHKELEIFNKVLENLEFTAGVLQQVGGCCNSSTVSSRNNSGIKLHKVELGMIRRFRGMLRGYVVPYTTMLKDLEQIWSALYPVIELRNLHA